MRCHSCPHSEAILRGEYDSKSWKELPCSKCKLGEDTFYSVPFDEQNPPAPAPACPQIPSTGGVPAGRGGYSQLRRSTFPVRYSSVSLIPSTGGVPAGRGGFFRTSETFQVSSFTFHLSFLSSVYAQPSAVCLRTSTRIPFGIPHSIRVEDPAPKVTSLGFVPTGPSRLSRK